MVGMVRFLSEIPPLCMEINSVFQKSNSLYRFIFSADNLYGNPPIWDSFVERLFNSMRASPIQNFTGVYKLYKNTRPKHLL